MAKSTRARQVRQVFFRRLSPPSDKTRNVELLGQRDLFSLVLSLLRTHSTANLGPARRTVFLRWPRPEATEPRRSRRPRAIVSRKASPGIPDPPKSASLLETPAPWPRSVS